MSQIDVGETSNPEPLIDTDNKSPYKSLLSVAKESWKGQPSKAENF